MHCIRTLARLETQRDLATQALRPKTKAERQKIDDDAQAHTQRAWDEYVSSRNAVATNAAAVVAVTASAVTQER